MSLYLIDPHEKRLYKNGIFNTHLDPNFISLKKVRRTLLGKGILLDTIDLHPVEKADKIFFFDHQNFSIFTNTLSPYLKLCMEKRIPKKKLNLIIIECPIIKPESWI